MDLDANVDQIVAVSRATTRDEQGRWTPEWAHEVLVSARIPVEDLTVQVKLTLNGCWHRKAIGGKTTACGIPLGGWASRDESYSGLLCEDGCFSPHELHELARLTASKDDDYVPDALDDDSDEAG
jgi:hypothetical protein